MNRLPAPLTMIEPGRLRSARQNHGAAGERDRRSPPGVVEERGLRPGGDAGEDAVAGVRRRAGRPLGGDRGGLVLLAHLEVELETTAAQDHAAGRPHRHLPSVAQQVGTDDAVRPPGRGR